MVNRLLKYFGLITFFTAFVGISIAIALNPWFDLTKNALSDLGRVGREYSYIFNYTLIFSSLFAIAYSFYIHRLVPNKLGCITTGIYIVGAFSLMAIGIFPEGTKLHGFVSYEFFILMSISLLLYGISLIQLRKTKDGVILVSLFVASALGSYFIRWPSVALLELFNIICYFFGFIILFISEKA